MPAVAHTSCTAGTPSCRAGDLVGLAEFTGVLAITPAAMRARRRLSARAPFPLPRSGLSDGPICTRHQIGFRLRDLAEALPRRKRSLNFAAAWRAGHALALATQPQLQLQERS